jgi:4-hydroxy-L-threonine phosphate dehydrogenase PdxA
LDYVALLGYDNHLSYLAYVTMITKATMLTVVNNLFAVEKTTHALLASDVKNLRISCEPLGIFS